MSRYCSGHFTSAIIILLVVFSFSINAMQLDGNVFVTVYDSTGVPPLTGGNVSLVSTNNTNSFTIDTTPSIQEFIFGHIPAGSYFIKFEFANYPVQYYTPLGSTTNPIESVVITANQDVFFTTTLTNNPHATIITSGTGTVKGVVTDITSNAPLENVRIVLFDFDLGDNFNPTHIQSQWTTSTNAAGEFLIENISEGIFRCMAEAESQQYVSQFYPRSDLPNIADLLPIDPGQSTDSVNFHLRKGGTLSGLITNQSGAPIGDAYVHSNNTHNTRWTETISNADGTWQLPGLPDGTWNVWVQHDSYLMLNDTIDRSYNLIERVVISIDEFRMQQGGFVAGTFTSELPVNNATIDSDIHLGDLHFYQPESTDFLWPRSSGMVVTTASSDGLSGSFASHVTAPGLAIVCFVPLPNFDNLSTTAVLQPGYGYTFLSSSTTDIPSFDIPSGDTLSSLSLSLRKGFSIFGTINNENNLPLSEQYGIDVFVHRNGTFFRIANAHHLSNGQFAIPGMVDNDNYYLQLWADGYPGQFWSPDNTTSADPGEPYHFNATTYSPLNLTIRRNPDGFDPGEGSGPVSLWVKDDSLGYPMLAWNTEPGLVISNFTLFRRDRTGIVTRLTSVPASSTETEYFFRDKTPGISYREYIITAMGTGLHLKSHPYGFDPQHQTSGDSLWCDVFSNHGAIQVEWGEATPTDQPPADQSTSDSILVYRSDNGSPPRLLFKRPSWEHVLHDHLWEEQDLGKTFTYHIEWPAKNLASPKVALLLSDSLFKSFSQTFTVGPYEQYQRISDAIAAAHNFDHIQVRSGTYKENLSFSGKILSLEGAWEYGVPPVIDGDKSVALTIPFTEDGSDWERPRISGIAFKNSSIGIKSFVSCEIEACLFDSTLIAVAMAIDSTAQIEALKQNPFSPSRHEAWIRHCTFIAQQAGALTVIAEAVGVAEQSGYTGEYRGQEQFYIAPTISLSTSASIELSSIAFYAREGNQDHFPGVVNGTTGTISCSRSNLFKTMASAPFGSIVLGEALSTLDPLFTDSTWWFTDNASPLSDTDYENAIGYDVRRFDRENGFSDDKQPSPVENLTATTVGFNAVMLQWSAAPKTDNVSYYQIYRIPGDTSLFYVTIKSQWDLKLPEDSIFLLIDSFSTTRTAFLDTTVSSGAPYVYVVAAVNNDGIESDINLPLAPPDISTYFVNSYPVRHPVAAGKWQMIGSAGATSIAPPADTQQVLFGWDDTRTPDKLYGNYYKSTTMQPTHGYWYKPEIETELLMSMESQRTIKAAASTTHLHLNNGTTGWNLVSSPFPFTITPSWLTDFTAWEWNSDSSGYRQAKAFVPWKAYWIYTPKDTTLALWEKPSLSSYLASQLAKQQIILPLWELTLSLQSGNSFDTDNRIGAVIPHPAKKAMLTNRKPPRAAFTAARLFLLDNTHTHSADRSTATQLSHQFQTVTPEIKALKWIVGIGASESPSHLTVHHHRSLPEGWAVYWIKNDSITALQQDSTIAFPPSSTDQFGILVATSDQSTLQRFTAALSLRLYTPHHRGRATIIEYTLPFDWNNALSQKGQLTFPVTLSLYDLAGRRIAKLIDKKQIPGVYTVVWNGKNRSNQQVAAGVYFARLSFGDHTKTARLYRIR